MSPPEAILFAAAVGFVGALVAGLIVYGRVYRRRLQLRETPATPPPDTPVARLTPHEEAMGAVRLRQEQRERERDEDVGIP